MVAPDLKASAFNCSLKSARRPDKSSTEVLLQQFLDAPGEHGVKCETIRAVDQARP
jgi:hypothetical protein